MSYKISSQFVGIAKISSGEAEAYIVIMTIVSWDPGLPEEGDREVSIECLVPSKLSQSAGIFMQLIFVNKEKKLLWFAVGELSDEIHTQASFPVTCQWDITVDKAVED